MKGEPADAARFLWLPPGARPPTALPRRQEMVFLLVGLTLLFSGYDMNVFGLALPQIHRFELRKQELAELGTKTRATADAVLRLIREHPRRLAALLFSVGGFGYAMGPATVLMSKYLQQTHHYHPAQITALFLSGGIIAVAGNIFAGRISDRFGRKRILLFCAATSATAYAVFYSGVEGWALPLSWMLAVFGFLAADALFAGLAVEIFPTAYRATISGLRYFIVILSGAVGLALEGVFYDRFGAHGPAIAIALAAMPVALIAILTLPEPARRVLEDITEDVHP